MKGEPLLDIYLFVCLVKNIVSWAVFVVLGV